MLAAGLDGIRNKRDPGKRLDIDMYTEGHTVKDAKRLPLNLLDALRALDSSTRPEERRSARTSRRLPQAQARRLERLRPPSHRVGAATRRSTAEVIAESLRDPGRRHGMPMKYSVLSARLRDALDAAHSRLDAGAGAMPSRSPPTTWSSSAAAGMGSRPPTISPRSTASPTSRCWRRAGSARGNAGRNTTIIRSNYLLPGNIPFYEWSMKLWEGLEQDLNYNAMVSQRGVLNLYHSDAQRDAFARRGNAMRLHGVDAELLDRAAGARACCRSSTSTMRASRSRAGCCSGAAARRGTTRWSGAMRAAADRRGVDIVAELRGHRHSPSSNGRVTGVDTTRGHRSAPARSASRSPATPRASPRMAGLRLPIESHVLQAFVSEGIKPLIDSVHDVRRRPLLHQPVRQGRAGVRRRHRRLQLLCPARQPAGGRGRHARAAWR